MTNALILTHYSIEIYNDHHSTSGLLAVGNDGLINGCLDLNSCDGWREELDGNTDALLDLAIEKANKSIKAGKAPKAIPGDCCLDCLMLSTSELDGNCANILANYEEEEEASIPPAIFGKTVDGVRASANISGEIYLIVRNAKYVLLKDEDMPTVSRYEEPMYALFHLYGAIVNLTGEAKETYKPAEERLRRLLVENKASGLVLVVEATSIHAQR